MHRARLLAVLAILPCAGLAGSAAASPLAPPPNDDLARAVVVDSVPFGHRENAREATSEPGEAPTPCAPEADRGVWFRFTAREDGPVDVTTAGSTYHAAVSVWIGGAHPLLAIACARQTMDGVGGEPLVFTARAGDTYYLKVEALGEGGDLVLYVHALRDRPANDDLGGAEAIPTLPFHARADVARATREAAERADACGGDGQHGVWYRYEPTVDGAVLLRAESADTALSVSVWVGERHPLAAVSCAAMYPSAAGDPVIVPMRAGRTYRVRVQPLVGGFAGGGPTWVTFDAAAPPPPPSNDDIAHAIDVGALPASIEATVRAATFEPDEVPPSCAPEAGGSVWYRLAVERPTRVRLTGGGAPNDVVLSAWEGEGHPMTERACAHGGAAAFAAAAGAAYWIQVAPPLPHPAGSGLPPVTFDVTEAPPPPPNDDLAGAVAIDGLPFEHASDTAAATNEPDEAREACDGTNPPSAGVWYRYTAATAGRVRLWTSEWSAVVSVWEGTGHPLRPVACRLGPIAAAPGDLTVPVVAGVAYAIRVGMPEGRGGLITLHAAAPPPPPANDDVARAVDARPLPFEAVADTTEATTEAGETPSRCAPSGPPRGVWYRVRTASAGRVVLRADGGPFRADLSVWTGSRFPLTEVACLDRTRFGDLVVDAAADTDYLVRLETTGPAPSTARIVVEAPVPIPPPPANDDLVDAVVIDRLPFADDGTTAEATTEPGEQPGSCGSGERGHSVWYRVTPDADGSLPVAVGLVDFPAVVTAWTGSSYPLAFVACSERPAPGWFAVPVRAGEPLWLQVQSTGTLAGRFRLEVGDILRSPQPPANDDQASAELLVSLPARVSGDTTASTAEPDEAASACSRDAGASFGVWYRLPPGTAGRIELGVVDAAFVAVVSVWSGTAHPLRPIACSDHTQAVPMTADLVAGERYFVKVEGTFGGGGPFSLDVGAPGPVPPPPDNDDLASARAIVALPFTDTVDVAEATTEPREALAGCAPSSRRADGVWYRYVAPEDGYLRLDTGGFGAVSGMVLSVWSGARHPLRPVACVLDERGVGELPLTIAVVAGQSYAIRIERSAFSSESLLTLRAYLPPPRPTNDDLADSLPIASLPFVAEVPIAEASSEPFEARPSCNAYETLPSVWYRVVPARTATLVLSAPDGNGTVAVWVGAAHPLREVACRRSLGAAQGTDLRLPVDAGTEYRIGVSPDAARGGDPGPIHLTIAEAPERPANDDLAAAVEIGSLPFSHAVEAADLTWEPGEAQPSCSAGLPGMWYRYKAPADGRIRLDGVGSTTYPTGISVWSGVAHPLREMACQAYVTEGGRYGSLTLNVRAGRTYYVRLAGGSGAQQEVDRLALNAYTPPEPPANDALAGATPIEALPFRDAVAAAEASREPAEAAPSCGSGETGSLWYRYAPAADGPVFLSAYEASTGDAAILSVWTGEVHPLTQLACDYNRLTLEAHAGTTYLIQVGAPGGNTPTVVLRARGPLPPAPNDGVENATEVRFLPFDDVVDNTGATTEPREEPSACDPFGRGGLWYRVALPIAQPVRVVTRGSAIPAVVSLWTGPGHPLDPVACAAPDGSRPWTSLTFDAEAGEEYLVRVEGANGAAGELDVGFEVGEPHIVARVYLPSAGR